MDLQHILLDGVSQEISYGGTGRGNFQRYTRTIQQRQSHGTHLAECIDNALPQKEYENYISDDEPGVYLEIISESGFPLALESLDTADCRLCKVNELDDGSQRATIFVYDKKRHIFLKKIESYKAQSHGRTHDKLFDNIARIRLVRLKDFWTSTPESYPDEDVESWWEVWLSRRSYDRVEVEDFNRFCELKRIPISRSKIEFELYTVVAIKAKARDLAESTTLISCLSELRKITDTASFILQQKPYEQADWMHDILTRTSFEIVGNVSVLILDQGVNYTHPLLVQGMEKEYCFEWDTDWAHYDSAHEHGTMQAGLVFYGDLSNVILTDENITIRYDIESCRIIPPYSSNEKELYGSLTYFAINEAEDKIGQQNRVVSMAISSDHDGITGQPTSWSSELDQLAYNGLHQRLFVISTGNIRDDDVEIEYANNVNSHSIEDPGQSWNSLTVGAYTNKVEISEHYYKNWTALSEEGDICPTSRASNSWEWKNEAPFKPDLVEEGGNLIVSPDGNSTSNADCVSLATTADHTSGRIFRDHGESSAACALVSRISAIVWDEYPDYWAETIRALLIHSANWTPSMMEYIELAQQNESKPRDAKEFMLRMFGHGVPNLQKAVSSQNNYLTMIVQSELSPYKVKKGDLSFDEMHLINFPWPKGELLSLGNANVKLRVTLSYFIEPNPGRRSYSSRFRYQSYGLRFKLINPNEDIDNFVQRTNLSEREEGFTGGADNSGWKLGEQLRTRGTIHQDTWEGPASELTLRNHIAVIPVAGWWKQRKSKLYEEKANLKVPYSLIVSLEVDEDIDIYSSVAQQVGIDSPVEVDIPVTT